MVVTRRTPAPPVAASRTASAQPIPRLGKKAPNDASSAPEKPSPLSNGSNYDAAGKKNDAGVGPLVSCQSFRRVLGSGCCGLPWIQREVTGVLYNGMVLRLQDLCLSTDVWSRRFRWLHRRTAGAS